MEDNDLIAQLDSLRSLQPSDSTLSRLKSDVNRQISQSEANVPAGLFDGLAVFFSALGRPQFALAASGVVVAVVLSVATLNLWPPEHALKTVQIALASNRYEKASLALALSVDEFGIYRQSQSGDLNRLKESIASTRGMVADLRLSGEPNLYTSEQCKALNLAYDQLLNELMQAVAQQRLVAPSSAQPALIAFETQVVVFENEVDQRMSIYQQK